MEDQVISVETAVLAKEKGFNVPVRSMYLYSSTLYLDKNTKGNYNDPNWVSSWRSSPTHDTLSAPTRSLLQTWLRDNYGIHIMVYPMERWLECGNKMEIYFEYYLKTTTGLDGLSNVTSKMLTFKKYEDALEVALQEGLNLIETK